MPFTIRFWGSTAVLLCALLVQSCQPHSVSATGEEELAASLSSSASAVRQRVLSEPPAVQSLAFFKEDHATLPSARALVPFVPSTFTGASNSSALPYNLLATERLDSHALYNAPGDAFSSVFTTSSGERVRFRQHDGQWCAVLAPGTSLNAQEHTLPVVSSGNIGALLSSLQGQDAWSSRSRIHVLATPTAPYSPCVYVGKVGLLGGVPTSPSQRVNQGSRTAWQEEWMQGPTMDLDSGHTMTISHTLPFPQGARFTGYRLQSGAEVKRASWVAWYVGADSRDVIDNIALHGDGGGRLAEISATAADIIPLGTLKIMAGRTSENAQRRAHVSSHSHASLVLYGKTKRNKLFRPKSRLSIALDVSYVMEFPPEASPASHVLTPQQMLPNSPHQAHAASVASSPLPAVASISAAHSAFESLDLQASHSKPLSPIVQALHVEHPPTDSKPPAQLPTSPSSAMAGGPSVSGNSSSDATMHTVTAQAEAEIEASSAAVQSVLSEKLSNPKYVLSDQDSIALLTHCVAEGERNAEKIKDKDALVVIGNTGTGKSTFLNYLLGCKLELVDDRSSLEDIVVVSPDSLVKEVMPIGHQKTSKTFIPQIEIDRADATVAYCDCPGFGDTRGAVINITNVVNIRRTLQLARSTKMLILINYFSLRADRGKGLRDILEICTQLFGDNVENLNRYQKSLLLGITQSPSTMSLGRVRSFLTKDEPPIMEILAERTFLYDPLDRGGVDFWKRAECLAAIQALEPIYYAGDLFQTVLTASDEKMLRGIVQKEGERASTFLSNGAYAEAATCWQTLQRLSVIDKLSVKRLLNESKYRLVSKLARMENSFREACHFYDMDKARVLLHAFEQITNCFSAESDLFDLPCLSELQKHYNVVEQCKKQEEERDRAHEAAKLQAAKDKQELLKIIIKQRTEVENRKKELALEYTALHAELKEQLASREKDYKQSLAAKEKELKEELKRNEEALSLIQVQALDTEERARLSAENAALKEEYNRNVKNIEEKWLEEKKTHKAQLALQKQAQERNEQALQSKIDVLSSQHKNEQQQLQTLRIPTMAFGAQEWGQYYGEVGELALPDGIEATLEARCPFWPDKQVRDTHLLVLIPAEVAGKPFTLNLLEELIKAPKGGGSKTEYWYYDNDVQSQVGNEAPAGSYWLLLTRDVLPESRSKTYTAQKALVAGHASRTGLSYELPKILEAATAILTHHVRTGERLYSDAPLTYTRCQELIRWGSSDYPSLVGGFESSGLNVVYHDHYSRVGVAGCRKFF